MVDQVQGAAQLLPILRAMSVQQAQVKRRRAKGAGARDDEKEHGEGRVFTVPEEAGEPDAHEAFLVRTLAEVLARNTDFDSPAARTLLQETRNGRIDWRTASRRNPQLMFLVQQIAQEIIGKGLYYEPWAEVIAAYRRVQPAGTAEIPPAPPERAVNFRS